MNQVKCGECAFFDQQYKFTPVGPRPAWLGWCSKKSVYPHRTPDGKTIPDGVQRAGEDEPICKPFIVEAGKVVVSCTDVVRK